MITLTSSDGQDFLVEEKVALQSQTIKNVMENLDEDNNNNDKIPLPNVTATILAKVVEYCNKHVQGPTKNQINDNITDSTSSFDENDLKEWDKEFIQRFDQSTLFEIILVSSLHLPSFLCVIWEILPLFRDSII
ncbi:SKP1-like protein 4 [Bienertia sinuspersici]